MLHDLCNKKYVLLHHFLLALLAIEQDRELSGNPSQNLSMNLLLSLPWENSLCPMLEFQQAFKAQPEMFNVDAFAHHVVLYEYRSLPRLGGLGS